MITYAVTARNFVSKKLQSLKVINANTQVNDVTAIVI